MHPNRIAEWFKRHTTGLTTYISIMLVIVIGALLAKLIWAFVPNNTETTTASSAPQLTNDPPNNLGENIAQTHLFGIAAPKASAPPPTAAPVDITLVGVVTGTAGMAIVAHAGTQKVAALGKTIESTPFTVESIASTHIMLRNGKTLTKLEFPKPTQQPQTTTTLVTPPIDNPAPMQDPNEPPLPEPIQEDPQPEPIIENTTPPAGDTADNIIIPPVDSPIAPPPPIASPPQDTPDAANSPMTMPNNTAPTPIPPLQESPNLPPNVIEPPPTN